MAKIKDKAIKGRRTGIGITAEGDMLAALGLRYGSDEAIDFSVNLHKNLAIEAYRSSVNLAAERGAFPIYEYSREERNPFINRLFNEDNTLKEAMKNMEEGILLCLQLLQQVALAYLLKQHLELSLYF